MSNTQAGHIRAILLTVEGLQAYRIYWRHLAESPFDLCVGEDTVYAVRMPLYKLQTYILITSTEATILKQSCYHF